MMYFGVLLVGFIVNLLHAGVMRWIKYAMGLLSGRRPNLITRPQEAV